MRLGIRATAVCVVILLCNLKAVLYLAKWIIKEDITTTTRRKYDTLFDEEWESSEAPTPTVRAPMVAPAALNPTRIPTDDIATSDVMISVKNATTSHLAPPQPSHNKMWFEFAKVGWNNQRQSMMAAAWVARTLNYTLVLPPNFRTSWHDKKALIFMFLNM